MGIFFQCGAGLGLGQDIRLTLWRFRQTQPPAALPVAKSSNMGAELGSWAHGVWTLLDDIFQLLRFLNSSKLPNAVVWHCKPSNLKEKCCPDHGRELRWHSVQLCSESLRVHARKGSRGLSPALSLTKGNRLVRAPQAGRQHPQG